VGLKAKPTSGTDLKEKGDKAMALEIWNSGRLYDRKGQVIVAEKTGENVFFCDASRRIYGMATALPEEENARETITRAYLNGRNYVSNFAASLWWDTNREAVNKAYSSMPDVA
jgi:hypothetical protein